MEPEQGEFYVNEDTGYFLTLEYNMRTYKQMLEGFYRANCDVEKPIAFQLTEDGASSITVKDWYAVMYRGWHIRIVKGRETPGPHQCQLWYKSGTAKKNYWVASLQLMGFYYNEDEMRDNLMAAIKEQEFYMTPKEEKQEIIP